ncbi:MAG: tetratricopeptide repeat protein, partial [Chlamydiae bacterium]|nr:tetratricopeptide repeat protein [Chlamydiota bacterium]
HYSLAKSAFEEERWEDVVRQSRIILRNFPGSVFAADVHFYLGIACFQKEEWDLANNHFSSYLYKQSAPKFFEEALRYKFQIAKQFASGAKKRLLGKESLPKVFSARREAIALYEEVIQALPQHDLAVQSLFGKGQVLFKEGDFKESIETYQTLLRRFPRHPLALDSYLSIIEVYRTQGDQEYPDPDYLDLAEIQLQKCKGDFPGDSRIAEAETLLSEMKELYAKDLYETAQFYERTKKKAASRLYYAKILSKYPKTESALAAQKRLDVLDALLGKPDPQIPFSEEKVLVEARESVSEEIPH